MDNITELLDTLVTRHLKRILIFLFALFIGMIVGATTASAQIKRVASPSPSPVTAKEPVPLTVGVIDESTETSITITDESGQKVSFKPAIAMRIEAPGITTIKGKPTSKNLAVGDRIAVASHDKATATLIVLASKGNVQAKERKAFLGVVSSREATNSGTILSLKAPKEDQFAKALVSSTTKITAKGIDKPVSDDVKAGDKVLVVGGTDSKEMILARALYLLPGKARSLLDKVASPSGSPKTATGAGAKSPAPSASAKASPTTKTTP